MEAFLTDSSASKGAELPKAIRVGQTFRKDLKRSPRNGWRRFELEQSLRAQRADDERHPSHSSTAAYIALRT